jgi:hypothetical protein
LFPDPQAGGRRIRWDKTKRRDLLISFAGHYRLREEPPSSGTIKKRDHAQGFHITERLTRLNIDSRGRARYRRIVTMAIQEVPHLTIPNFNIGVKWEIIWVLEKSGKKRIWTRGFRRTGCLPEKLAAGWNRSGAQVRKECQVHDSNEIATSWKDLRRLGNQNRPFEQHCRRGG